MTADEKRVIYNLLKTADGYNSGYCRGKFAGQVTFSDDEEGTPASAENAGGKIDTKAEMLFQTSGPALPEGSDARPGASQITPGASLSTPPTPDKPSPATPTTHKLTMEELTAKILRCTRCTLARTRNNVVPGEGVLNPDVLVIGEGPGYDEDMQGRPFVGKAGMLLDKMLNAIHLDRKTNTYIANVVKCRPPENRNPFPDEQSACFSFLETQIHLLKPKMILCMGKISIEKLMKQSVSINQSHGQIFDYYGIPVMATYHPSALLRNAELKKPAWDDLRKFRTILNQILNKENP